MEKLYEGIDLPKESFVRCIMDRDGNIISEHTFSSLKKAVERFFCIITNSELTIAIESCEI